MRKSPLLVAMVGLSAIGLRADSSPVLQWVATMGGSGANQVIGAAADSHGNLYIAGNTTSLDFPTVAAAQPAAGASTLVRIATATGISAKLYPPGLSIATSIAADPRNAQALYATAANAIWHSTDAGATWTVLYRFASTATVGCVAVDPANSNNLYAGTSPLGVFKSADGGLTWTAIDNGIAPASDGILTVLSVAVDPKSPQVLFASTSTGLMRTSDGGSSWALIGSRDYDPVIPVFDPFTPGTLYLSNGQGIEKSTDDGQTFAFFAPLPGQISPATLLADPLHAGILYASSYGGIYQSVDSGLTWTQKTSQAVYLLAADPNNPVLYAGNYSGFGIVKSTDGFNTTSPLGPPETSLVQMIVAGSNLFLVAVPSYDVFVVKLDPNGNTVYSTYLGGSADDLAVAMALGADGSVYVTGSTASIDFPGAAGAYSSTIPGPSSNFLFKLNPDGSEAWATYFALPTNTVNTVTVDSAGSPYVGGLSRGGLPTTAGAYQPQFNYMCIPTGFIGCIAGPSSAFVTKFNPQGTALVYSTYVSSDSQNDTIETAQALAVDSNGNAYFGGSGAVVLLNAAGSALLASGVQPGFAIDALALDASSNVYATGTWNEPQASVKFPATPGAFQPAPQPAVPSLPYQEPFGGGAHAFAVKWDSRLSQILAATLLSGEETETGESIALDASGDVIVSGSTSSKAFPTHAPFQSSFSSNTGFVAGLDATLSHLLFSTYLGDSRPFNANAAIPVGNGDILVAGGTPIGANTFYGIDSGASYSIGGLLVANKISLPPAPAVRLDSVVNVANQLDAALAPGEAIIATGAGFGTGAQLLLDGVPLAGVTVTSGTISGTVPSGANTAGAFEVQVASGGTLSNTVSIPAAPASPGLYSVDGSGYNQGYILNGDGTLNSPSNPAAVGSPITIFVNGAGSYSLSGPYAVAAQAPSVFIYGFYADGIAATVGPVAGLPGNVYQLSVFVPNPANYNPDLRNIKIPPQVGVVLVMGPVNMLNFENSSMISQPGLVLNVQQ